MGVLESGATPSSSRYPGTIWPSTTPLSYWPKTTLPSSIGRMLRSTFTFSVRMASASKEAGTSMAMSVSSWVR